ncbi:hypothetical protein KJ564_08140, partial [bacterium]|nr:hypothetical protein [bacterium]
VATTGGVLRYHRTKNEWLDPWVIVLGRIESVDLRNAYNVDYVQDENAIAVQTNKGTFTYNFTFKNWQPSEHDFEPPLPATEVTNLAFLNMPDYSVSGRSFSRSNEVGIMDNKLRKYGFSIFADDQFGDAWVGIEGVGVLQLNKYSQRGIVWELGLSGSDVRAIAFGENWYCFGGHNRSGGISFYRPKRQVWDHLSWEYTMGLQSTWINDFEVSGKYLLAATDLGLAQINLKNGGTRTYAIQQGLWSNLVTSVAVDKDTVWVGMEDGVCKLFLPKGPVKRLEQPSLRTQPVYRLEVDSEALWVGGESGLYRYDRKSGKGKYIEGGSVVGGQVYAMFNTPTELWTGRFNGIKVTDKKTLKEEGWSAQAFFDGAEVYAIAKVDSLVFVGTDNGLYKFDRTRNRWHRFSEEDGLIDNHVTALYQDGDYLIIGTKEGVTQFFWNDPMRID